MTGKEPSALPAGPLNGGPALGLEARAKEDERHRREG